MLPLAVIVVSVGCAMRFAPTVFAEPLLWAGLSLVAWFLAGAVAGVATMLVAWICLTLGWTIDDRLHPALVGEDILVTGTICDFPRERGRATRFLLHTSPDAIRLPSRLYLGSYGELRGDLAAGQRWQLKVRLKRPRGLANPGGFDFERWTLERRIGATGYVRNSALNRRLPPRAGECPTISLRQAVASRIEAAVGSPGRARFLLALAVGARHRLTTDDWSMLRRTGTTHLMAISGLHVGLVAGLLFWLGRGGGALLLSLGSRVAPMAAGRLCAVSGAAAYSLLAGFSVPTLRAFAMVVVVAALAGTGRAYGGWRILGFAALVVVSLDPLALLGSGFWLSFGAVTILMVSAAACPAREVSTAGVRVRIARRGGRLVRAQLALTLGLAPLAIAFFGAVPLLGATVNLLFVPFFAAWIVPLTLAGTALLVVLPGASSALLGVAAASLDAGLHLLSLAAELPFASRPIGLPGFGWLALAIIGIFVLIWPRPMPLRLVGLLPFCLLTLGPAEPTGQRLRVVVMDVGQGLAVLVQTSRGALLYDAGPGYGDSDAGRTVVLPVLRRFGVQRLDLVVASHGDNDHVGGLHSVLDAYPDAALLATERFGLAPKQFSLCSAGTAWRWGGVRFAVLGPNQKSLHASVGDNDRSCVLGVFTNSASLLLPGDIERRGEAALIAAGLSGPFDVVIAPHHGSATSSSDGFVASVAARYVVFSTGYLNRWAFPRARVQRRWRRSGACLLDTAMTGAIVFEADEQSGLRLASMHRADARRVWHDGVAPPGCPSAAL